ncbi:MAG TPA: hypothetical protein VLY87_07200 [Flavobacterium sp.]|nr:hypothetical protein [Flavobacterium sp.]
MKKIFTIALTFITLSNYAQEVSVEKSTFGVQTGYLGIWVHNETKLSNTFSLRSEIGFDSGIWGGDFYDKTGLLLAPVLTVEPRLYYNLSKRQAHDKRTSNNNGNFISLKTSYHPDWFVISNTENVKIISDISLIPTWGIKRNISNSNFVYEAGFGVGYQYVFAKQAGFIENESNIMLNLHLRIGYSF